MMCLSYSAAEKLPNGVKRFVIYFWNTNAISRKLRNYIVNSKLGRMTSIEEFSAILKWLVFINISQRKFQKLTYSKQKKVFSISSNYQQSKLQNIVSFNNNKKHKKNNFVLNQVKKLHNWNHSLHRNRYS